MIKPICKKHNRQLDNNGNCRECDSIPKSKSSIVSKRLGEDNQEKVRRGRKAGNSYNNPAVKEVDVVRAKLSSSPALNFKTRLELIKEEGDKTIGFLESEEGENFYNQQWLSKEEHEKIVEKIVEEFMNKIREEMVRLRRYLLANEIEDIKDKILLRRE